MSSAHAVEVHSFDNDKNMSTNSEKIIDSIVARSSKPWISVEFFPPKSDAGVVSLSVLMKELKNHQPVFVDFTWGAGGSTSDLTLDLCRRAKSDLGMNPNMHLTCTNMELEKVDAALEGCKLSGITNILALRGDPPAGQAAWAPVEGGFSCALDLVRYIKKKYGDEFCTSVAGYPEGHPSKILLVEGGVTSLSPSELLRYSVDVDEATGAELVYVCKDVDFAVEMAYLKEKVDAGAEFIVTQMFFDTDLFRIFVDACRNMGINVPILPGIMCISTYGGFKRMGKFCRSRVPAILLKGLEDVKDDEAAVRALGLKFGEEMCRCLLAMGAPGLHFYTLNQLHPTTDILTALGFPSVPPVETHPVHVNKSIPHTVRDHFVGETSVHETHLQIKQHLVPQMH